MKKIALLLITSFISSCSSLWEEIAYIPVDSDSWDIEVTYRVEENIAPPKGSLSAKYFCANAHVKVDSFIEMRNAFWGPPIFPIIPKLSDRKIPILLSLNNISNLKSCPEIIINNNIFYGNMDGHDLPWRKSTTICSYEIDRFEGDELKIVDEELECEIMPLKFRRISEWKYRSFVVPRT